MGVAERIGRAQELVVRGEPRRAGEWAAIALTAAGANAGFGVVMGSFDLGTPDRLWLPVFGAIKAPMLVVVTTALCLPGFFVLSTALGLRSTFSRSIASIVCGQAAQALALCSLGPVLAFIYLSGITHAQALTWCAVMYGVATIVGYTVLIRRYRPLLRASRRHRVMLVYWLIVYAFVGVRMGWMLRPFVGTPGLEVTFVRQEPFTNAYVAVFKIVRAAVEGGATWRR